MNRGIHDAKSNSIPADLDYKKRFDLLARVIRSALNNSLGMG